MDLPYYLQAILAGLFTWGVTALGASLIFFFKKANQNVLTIMLGFAGGVMIAASFWSLLSPAIESCEELGLNPWLVPALGFVFGGAFIISASFLLDKFSFKNVEMERATKLKKGTLLMTAMTLHNIPEGLAVGVGFGSVAVAMSGSTLMGAILLAVGIGIQNFPEGASVSFPLLNAGISKGKSFFYGQLSGVVEPIACIIGFFLAVLVQNILPFLLAFSAGAMIGVVASEILPEASNNNKNLGTIGAVLGFMVMMILDVALS